MVSSVIDEFSSALYGTETGNIPKEYDWFAPLIGDWDFDYCDCAFGTERHVEGEWIFRRILNGSGIEDLFICPSRATAKTNPQPDGGLGVAVRMFNSEKKQYDMIYAEYNNVGLKHLAFKKEGERLVGTVESCEEEKWVFAEISENTFHWQNITRKSDGTETVNSNIYAKRKFPAKDEPR